MTVYVFREAGARGVALQTIFALGPAAVAAPFAATLADRYPRVRVMVLSDALRVPTSVASAVLVASGGPLIAVLLVSSVRNVIGAPFEPAKQALLPTLATEADELTATNVASSTIASTSIFLGPALGGLLVALTSVQVVLLFTGATFALSAALVAGIRNRDAPPADTAHGEPEGFVKQVLAGARVVAATPALRLVVGLMAAQTFLDGVLGVLLAVVALDLLDVGSGGLGVLNGMIGIGGLLGAAVAAGLVGRRLSGSFALGCALWGLPLALIGAAPEVLVAAVALGLVGIGNTLVDVSGFTLLQRLAPEDVAARVFGLLEGAMLTAVVVGAALAPGLDALLGTRGALVVAGLLLPAVTLASLAGLRRIDAATPALLHGIERLRGVELLAPLGSMTLERLAGALEPISATAGTDIVRQGAPGDAFYVVDEGEVEVLVDGRPVRRHGRGESFGEIALLRAVPRTATVRATEDARLLALPRAAFLAAVTASPSSVAAAESVVTSRLGWARPAA